jgi:hypothetical protein
VRVRRTRQQAKARHRRKRTLRVRQKQHSLIKRNQQTSPLLSTDQSEGTRLLNPIDRTKECWKHADPNQHIQATECRQPPTNNNNHQPPPTTDPNLKPGDRPQPKAGKERHNCEVTQNSKMHRTGSRATYIRWELPKPKGYSRHFYHNGVHDELTCCVSKCPLDLSLIRSV